MPVKYNVVERKNPQNREARGKYYPQAIAKGRMTLRRIAQEISDRSSLSIMDVLAVLEGFMQIIAIALGDGLIVDLGDFGTFRLTITAKGADEPEDVTAAAIERATPRFRPGRIMRKLLHGLEYERGTADDTADTGPVLPPDR